MQSILPASQRPTVSGSGGNARRYHQRHHEYSPLSPAGRSAHTNTADAAEILQLAIQKVLKHATGRITDTHPYVPPPTQSSSHSIILPLNHPPSHPPTQSSSQSSSTQPSPHSAILSLSHPPTQPSSHSAVLPLSHLPTQPFSHSAILPLTRHKENRQNPREYCNERPGSRGERARTQR